MYRYRLPFYLLVLTCQPLAAQETVFSGPQIGERLRGFKAIQMVGEKKGEAFDPMAEAGEKPVLMIFFHKLTRPAFGLTRLLLSYAESKPEALVPSVIMLSEDPKAAMEMGALAYFPKDLLIGVSPDGIEGPGAYGLNRNVELTVLVGKESHVTANFALVQPSLAADGPKILEAVAELIGEEVPSLDELQQKLQTRNGRMRGQRMRRSNSGKGNQSDTTPNRSSEQDEQLTGMLRRLLADKQATPEQTEQGIRRIEAYVTENVKAKRDLISRAKRIVDGELVERYGNETLQAAIRRWAKGELGSQDNERH